MKVRARHACTGSYVNLFESTSSKWRRALSEVFSLYIFLLRFHTKVTARARLIYISIFRSCPYLDFIQT